MTSYDEGQNFALESQNVDTGQGNFKLDEPIRAGRFLERI